MHGDFVARRVASCLITGESSRKQLATKSVPILQVSLSNKSSYPTKEGCFGDFGTHTDVWIQFASLLRFVGFSCFLVHISWVPEFVQADGKVHDSWTPGIISLSMRQFD